MQISETLWKYLNQNKLPGESFNNTIIRLLKIEKELKKNDYSYS